jgi:hypothetical protein
MSNIQDSLRTTNHALKPELYLEFCVFLLGYLMLIYLYILNKRFKNTLIYNQRLEIRQFTKRANRIFVEYFQHGIVRNSVI